MPKPKPTAEIVAIHVIRKYYELYYASEDARSWLMSNAGEFGKIFPHEKEPKIGFNVYPNYENIDEVINYLVRMGE